MSVRPDDGTYFIGYPTAIGAIAFGVGMLVYIYLGLPGLDPDSTLLHGRGGYFLGFASIGIGIDQLRRGRKQSRSQ